MIKRPPNINADEMETNPVNKACITATNDVIVPKTRHTRLRSPNARLDILIFALIARLDILVFALNRGIRHTHLRPIRKIRHTHLRSTRKTRNTRLRSHREIRYTHLRFQMARLGILVFALIHAIRRYINLNFAQSQYDDRFEFRFIKMRQY